MKTFQSGTTIFNLDAGGTVFIKQEIPCGLTVKIPLEDLINFVGEVVRADKISVIEQVSARELLMGRRPL